MLTDDEISEVIVKLMNMSDDEAIPYLTSEGYNESDIDEIMDLLEAVKSTEGEATDDILSNDTEPSTVADDMTSGQERVASDAIEQAEHMANEDDTPVTVEEKDSDNDGDPDKVTIKKDEPEKDKLTPEEEAAWNSFFDDSSKAEDKLESKPEKKSEDNNDKKNDKPHDQVLSDRTMKNIISTISSFRF